ncbi:MAG: hypothetical protein HZA31_08065 [Opitutae bacterium]|nr:hypothetical protein [Opitutae bacterium]
MKSLVKLAFLTAALGLFSVLASAAAGSPADKSAKPAAYPLATCVVSGEKLGEMGAPIDYTYKQAGQPDRLVRFCCKSCIKKFEKDPAKYLKKLDEAAAKAPAAKADPHAGHNH